MDKSPADPFVGTTIAQYEVVAKLGGGGMGVVYAARDTRLGRTVALKFLPPQWSHDEGAKQRFIREAQAASATDHRNICTIHDINTTGDGRLFIVMAHYEGHTLKQRLESGPLPVDDAIEIAAQIAEGLAKAHAQGVVHRDIKPGNLMLTEDGIKILDFGLAKFADARLKLTLEGSTIGTIAYMSPEQARGEDADIRTDVWATGVVLYEMLTGQVPFKGGYPEAIAHAIKTEPPASIRAAGIDIPEVLEQLVFRALHKNPAVRYQSARDLARALRMLQGRTLPLDLRTEPIPTTPPNRPSLSTGHPSRRLRKRVWITSTAAMVVIATSGWMFWPVQPVAVAIAPFANQTQYRDLDAYRLALTQELIAQLHDTRGVRVMSYDRLLELLRPFRSSGTDISSPQALQALVMQADTAQILVPSLVYTNGELRARIERRDPETGLLAEVFRTSPRTSAFLQDAAYSLVPELAAGALGHFAAEGPLRASLAMGTLRLVGRGPTPPANRLRTPDAAVEFERGLGSYEQLEYAAAKTAFARSSAIDSRHPLPLAWRSRVALLMRQDKEATEAADQAASLAIDNLSLGDRLFAQAVIAEARGDITQARTRYEELAASFPDEPAALMELAGFQDRQGSIEDAISNYLRVVALRGPVRAHLELCRLYSPSRRNLPVEARQQGQLALTAYTALGNRGGEAQALWCLTDVLRTGSDVDRREARSNAETALKIMQELEYPYGLARAYNYVAVVALLAERNGREAADYFEKALAATRSVGNVFLESRILMNLGVSYEMFGQRSKAVQFYGDSFRLFEQLRNGQEAAWSQVNRAGILIEYGGDPEEGLRDADNALAVFQNIDDKFFEVHARRVRAWYFRYTGRPDDARNELNLAQNVAREHALETPLAQVAIDQARLQVDQGDYAGAESLLSPLLTSLQGLDAVHARLELARVHTRLGLFDAAAVDVEEAGRTIDQANDTGSQPLLDFARGELAYEAGRLDDARAQFSRASEYWTDDLAEAASVEARGFVGLIDTLRGQTAGTASIQACVTRARQMKRLALEARCRIFEARAAIASRRFEGAAESLKVAADAVLGPELAAQVHYWRSRAFAGTGDTAGANQEIEAARRLIDGIAARTPAAWRPSLLLRPDIQAIKR